MSIIVADIVNEYLEGETDEFKDLAVWSLTGWPCFWRGDPGDSFRLQLADVRHRMDTCQHLVDDMGEVLW